MRVFRFFMSLYLDNSYSKLINFKKMFQEGFSNSILNTGIILQSFSTMDKNTPEELIHLENF